MFLACRRFTDIFHTVVLSAFLVNENKTCWFVTNFWVFRLITWKKEACSQIKLVWVEGKEKKRKEKKRKERFWKDNKSFFIVLEQKMWRKRKDLLERFHFPSCKGKFFAKKAKESVEVSSNFLNMTKLLWKWKFKYKKF